MYEDNFLIHILHTKFYIYNIFFYEKCSTDHTELYVATPLRGGGEKKQTREDRKEEKQPIPKYLLSY